MRAMKYIFKGERETIRLEGIPSAKTQLKCFAIDGVESIPKGCVMVFFCHVARVNEGSTVVLKVLVVP